MRKCYAITCGKPVIEGQSVWYDIELTDLDKWIGQFKEGDTNDMMEARIAPRKMLTAESITDTIMEGIKKACAKHKIYSWRLELNNESGWWFLLGTT